MSDDALGHTLASYDVLGAIAISSYASSAPKRQAVEANLSAGRGDSYCCIAVHAILVIVGA